jgi:N-acetylglucosaminyl-diphospho-decaprenol L-rhamnosyltransferase
MLDLSIIIVTYQSAAVLAACLTSIATALQQNPTLHCETLVIDNGSQDDTLAIAARFDVRVMHGHGNIGFAQANNLGMQQAQGRYFLLLNPDTEVKVDALTALVTFADAHPQAGLVGPQLVNPDGSLQHSTFRFPGLQQAFFGFFEKLVPLDSVANGRYPSIAYAQERQTEHILGAALLVRRNTWQALGGMDANFHLYFEETDWCWRVKQSAWQVWYTPSATVMHIGGHTTSKNPERSALLFAQARAYFYRKHYGWGKRLLLKLLTFVGIGYWAARTTWGRLRGRVTAETFARRWQSYAAILRA